MKNSFRRNYWKILESITFKTSKSFIFNNVRYTCESNVDGNNSDSNYPELKDLIYVVYHCRRTLDNVQISESINEEFLGWLSKANTGLGTWDSGWTITNIQGKNLIVQKDGLTLWTTKKEFTGYNNTKNIGSNGLLFLQKEYRLLNPGFYMALSNATFFYHDHVKVYWNIKPEGAALLLNEMTKTLNHLHIPFRFKVLNNLDYYPRSDAAVLYVDRTDFKQVRRPIQKVYRKVKGFLNPETSFFAKRLGPGIALAEDIIDEEGFGQRISRILAEAIFVIHNNKQNLPRHKIILSQFKKNNLDANKPYLSPNSRDMYGKI